MNQVQVKTPFFFCRLLVFTNNQLDSVALFILICPLSFFTFSFLNFMAMSKIFASTVCFFVCVNFDGKSVMSIFVFYVKMVSLSHFHPDCVKCIHCLNYTFCVKCRKCVKCMKCKKCEVYDVCEVYEMCEANEVCETC